MTRGQPPNNRSSHFKLREVTERCSPEFKIRDIFALEFNEAEERCNIEGNQKGWPVLIELALEHSWEVAIKASVNANKLHTSRHEQALVK